MDKPTIVVVIEDGFVSRILTNAEASSVEVTVIDLDTQDEDVDAEQRILLDKIEASGKFYED